MGMGLIDEDTEELLESLLGYDFTKPHERVFVFGHWIKFKPTQTDEGLFYVPSYISPLNHRRGWRVRMQRTNPRIDRLVTSSNTPLIETLNEAWQLVLNSLLNEEIRAPKRRSKEGKSLDTGITGVRLAWNRPNDPEKCCMLLRVLQSTEHQRAYHETFYSFERYPEGKAAFDRQYERAIAARRYYEHLRTRHYRIPDPITVHTHIPKEFYPETLPVPDLYERMMTEVKKRKASQ